MKLYIMINNSVLIKGTLNLKNLTIDNQRGMLKKLKCIMIKCI